jgi:hypothetical protein
LQTQTPEGTATEAEAPTPGDEDGTPLATLQPAVTGTTTIVPGGTITATLIATATGTSTATVELTPEPTGTGTPETVAPTPLPPDCTLEIDPTIEAWLLILEPAELVGFECAALPAESNTAEVLAFEQGYMAALEGEEGIVVYDESEAWEIRNPEEELGNFAPDPDEAPVGLFAPTGDWRAVWQQPGVYDTLGWALAPDPVAYDVTQQRFPGGLVVADPTSGLAFKIPLP